MARMKTRLGQHFLVSPTAPRAIVAAAGSLRDRTVLEIGPGHGALTDLLASAAGRLIAVELDDELARALTQTHSGAIEVRNQDILHVDLRAIAESSHARLIVIGNLPYYITADILLHLFAHADAIERAVIMMQREVADRVCATPGSREYGLLTCTTQLYAEAERLFDLPPTDFAPPPEVHSSVVRLSFAPRFAALQIEPAGFLPFLRKCFAQKRKTLANNLKAAGYPAGSIDAACQTAAISPQARAESLPLETFAALYHSLSA